MALFSWGSGSRDNGFQGTTEMFRGSPETYSKHHSTVSLAEAAKIRSVYGGEARVVHDEMKDDVVLGLALVTLLDKIPREGIALDDVPGTTSVEHYRTWLDDQLLPSGLALEVPGVPGSYARTPLADEAMYDVKLNVTA